MSLDGQFDLEEKRDILSLHPSSSSGHVVSDVDDEKSLNNDERVCQFQSGQMDAFTSTPKAAAAPRPIDQLQLEAKSMPSKQTLSPAPLRSIQPSILPTATALPAHGDLSEAVMIHDPARRCCQR